MSLKATTGNHPKTARNTATGDSLKTPQLRPTSADKKIQSFRAKLQSAEKDKAQTKPGSSAIKKTTVAVPLTKTEVKKNH